MAIFAKESVSDVLRDKPSRLHLLLAHTFGGAEEKLALFHRLADLIDVGVPIRSALEEYVRGFAAHFDKSESRIVMLKDVMDRMYDGDSFAKALAPWVSPTEAVILESGQSSGHIQEALRNAGKITQATQEIKTTIWAAMSEPLLNLAIICATAVYYGKNLIPVFAKMSDPNHWPAMMYLFYASTMLITNWWWIALIVMAVLFALAMYSLPRLTGRMRTALDRIPPYNIYRRLQGVSFLMGVGMMLQTKMPMAAILDALRTHARTYMQGKLDEAESALSDSTVAADQRIGKMFDIDLLPPEQIVDIGLYSQSAAQVFPDRVMALADQNTKDTIKWIQGRIGKVGLAVDLFVVGYTTISLLSMMDIQNVLQAAH